MSLADKEKITGEIVLIRHGQSRDNLDDIFAGWVDSPLTPKGIEQAQAAGDIVKRAGFTPDIVYSSPLSRAMDTVKEALGRMRSRKQITEKNELLERHYGSMTGLNKKETKEILGNEAFQIVHRAYDGRPDPMPSNHPAHPDGNATQDRKAVGMPPNGKGGESLSDVIDRLEPFWKEVLLPDLRKGKKILIGGHNTNLRALTLLMEGKSREEIKEMSYDDMIKYDLKNATPIKYDFTFTRDKNEFAISPRQEGEAIVQATRRDPHLSFIINYAHSFISF